MPDCLEISSHINFTPVIDEIIKFSDIDIDFFMLETLPGRKKRYFFSIKSKNKLPREYIAKVLSEWILTSYEKKFLAEILTSEFVESCGDQKKIISKITDQIDLDRYFSDLNYIVKKLTNYFESENIISIDGFVRFRLWEYRRELYELVYDAAEEFYIEKEYREFIGLLSEYINECLPMIDLLHISYKSSGEFMFYDFSKTNIRIDTDKTTVCNPIENFLTNEDMLINILIALAPKRIIWHSTENYENQNIAKTIKEIFQERFSVCCGCELCHRD